MGVRNTGSGVRRARSSVTVGKLFHPELQSPWQVGGGAVIRISSSVILRIK